MIKLLKYLVGFAFILAFQPGWANPMWLSSPNAVYVITTSGGELEHRFQNGAISQLVALPGKSAWALNSQGLLKLYADGTVGENLIWRDLGLSGPNGIVTAVDSRSGSTWLALDSQLIQIDATGKRTAGLAVDRPVQAMVVGLDQTLWITTDTDILQIGPDGSELSRRHLSETAVGTTSIAFDALPTYLWLATNSSLSRFDLGNRNSSPLTIALSNPVSVLAADSEKGRVWAISGDELISISRNGVSRSLGRVAGSGSIQLQLDPATGTVWTLRDKQAVKRDGDGKILSTIDIPSVSEQLRVAPLLLTPILKMQNPPPDLEAPSPLHEIVFELGVDCAGHDCSDEQDFISGMTLEISLNQLEIGSQFVIDPKSRTARYTFETPIPSGKSDLTAQARDRFGNLSQPFSTSFTIATQAPSALIAKEAKLASVAAAAATPTVSITAPTNNKIITVPGPVTLTASASETGGTIAKVEFFTGSTSLGSKTASPYTVTWNNLVSGTYTLTAKATDTKAVSATSAPITLIVNAPPNVTLTAPANNAVVAPGTNVNLTATAGDADGTVSKVEFYQGTVLLSTSATAPYLFTWNNVVKGSYSLTAKATDNRGAITSSSPVTLIVNAAPTVSLTAPLTNTVVAPGSSVKLTATASDTDGTIAKVDFFNGAALLGTSAVAPYSFTWNSVVAGSYALTAKATDNRGTATTSSAATLIVNSAPTVSLTAPANNTIIAPGKSVTLTAAASDSDGTIAKVEFYQGTTLLGTATAAPFTFTWNSVAKGSYTLTAKATDNRGAVTVSAPISLVVNTAPTISLTAPVNNATVAPGANVTLTASAADSDGTIAQVEFFQGATKLGQDTTSPYSFTWNNLAVGTYVLTAKATDNQGTITTSAPVTLNVQAAAPAVLSVAHPTVDEVIWYGEGISVGPNYTMSGSITGFASPAVTLVLNDGSATTYKPTVTANQFTVGVPLSVLSNATLLSACAHPANTTPCASDALRKELQVPFKMQPLSIQIQSQRDGEVIFSGSSIDVTGTFDAPEGATVTVNGVNATVNGHDFSATLPIAVNTSITVNATVSIPGGAGARKVINISRTDAVIPTVSITGPSPNLTTSSSIVFVSGVVDPPSTNLMLFNGRDTMTMVPHDTGNFLVNVPLVAGRNNLSITAFGPGGVSANAAVTVDRTSSVGTPAIVLTKPIACAVFPNAPATVTLAAQAVLPGGTIYRVNFYANGQYIGTSDKPYELDWSRVNDGSYQILAKMLDDTGAIVATSTPVTITVGVAQPPSCVLTSPTDLARFTTPGDITLTASAATSAPGTTIAKVEFFYKSELLATVTSPPYTYTWTNPPAGADAITARATDSRGAVTTSERVTALVYNPLSVAVTEPADGAIVTSPFMWAASSQGGVIENDILFELLDGAVTWDQQNVSSGQSMRRMATLSPGVHILTARASDSGGSIATSAPVTITVAAAPTVGINVDAISYLAPAAVTLRATPVVTGSVVSQVDFYQGVTLLGTITAPPFAFRWTNVAAGNYSVTAKVTTSTGSTATSTPVAVSVGNTPTLTIDPVLSGSMINDDRVSITGKVFTSLNSVIDINGVTGSIAADGTFVVNNVPLPAANNNLTVTVTTPDGQTTKQTLVLGSSGPAAFLFTASQSAGLAPLAVSFSLTKTNNVTVKRIEMYCDDRAGISFTVATFANGSLGDCTYASAGIYRARVDVISQPAGQPEGVIYSGRQYINAIGPAYLDNLLRGVYLGMLDKLKAGNVAGALNAITAGVNAKYKAIFNDIGANLPAVIDQLGVIKQGTLGDEMAEYVIVRPGSNGLEGYMIYLIRGEDGIWRIDGM